MSHRGNVVHFQGATFLDRRPDLGDRCLETFLLPNNLNLQQQSTASLPQMMRLSRKREDADGVMQQVYQQ